ncbi:MAG: hypothetical protein AAF571_06300 [Verrucomicrobiota bacterium]
MKQNSKKIRLIYPGPENWEHFEGSEGSRCLPCSTDQPHKDQKVLIALPNRWLFSFYLPLQVPDAAQLKDMLVLQLEKNELPATEEAWSFLELGQTGSERCVHLFSLPEIRNQSRLSLPDIRIESAAPAWAFREINEEHICLVKELGRWGLWYYKEGKCHYSRDLGVANLTAASLTLIEQTIWHLQSSGLNTDKPQITFIHPVPQEFIQALVANEYTYRDVTLTNPYLPQKLFSLQPETIRERRQTEQAKRNRNKLIAGAVVLFTIIALTVAGLGFYIKQQTDALRDRIATLAPQAEKLQLTDALWKQVELATEPNLSPLETMHRVTRTLPENNLRMTKYQQLNNTIVISGESKQHSQIFDWVKKLKASPMCAHMQWSDPRITMLPGNLVKFDLEGTIRYAPAE